MSNIWTIGITAVLSIVAFKIFDEVLLFALAKFWPEKYLSIFYGWIIQFESMIDKLEEKYPKVGKQLRQRLVDAIHKIEDIIADKM